MKYIDLHVHSNASDGSMQPSEVVTLAYESGLSAFALTDHDTLQGIEEAMQQAKLLQTEGKEIRVIPGVEISVAYKKKDIHMLGLLIDYKNPILCNTLADARAERISRNEKMAANLRNAGIDISLEALTKFCGKDTVLTRAHFANYLTAHHYTKNNKDAFDKYLNETTPYYVPRNYMAPKDAIALILQADGIPVLAHPLLYHLPEAELDFLISQLTSYGLMGIETIYSSNTGFDEGILRRYANKYHLLMTGGSDFHGLAKPDISIGTGRGNLKIPYSLLTNLENAKKQLLENQ